MDRLFLPPAALPSLEPTSREDRAAALPAPSPRQRGVVRGASGFRSVQAQPPLHGLAGPKSDRVPKGYAGHRGIPMSGSGAAQPMIVTLSPALSRSWPG